MSDDTHHELNLHEQTLRLLQPHEQELLNPLVADNKLDEKLVMKARSDVRKEIARKYWRLRRRLSIRKTDSETRITSIPRWIDRQAGLTELQKRLLARVDFFEEKGQGFFETNMALAIELERTPAAIREVIRRLVKAGWLTRELHADGRRFLVLNRSKFDDIGAIIDVTGEDTSRDRSGHESCPAQTRDVTGEDTTRVLTGGRKHAQASAKAATCSDAEKTESGSQAAIELETGKPKQQYGAGAPRGGGNFSQHLGDADASPVGADAPPPEQASKSSPATTAEGGKAARLEEAADILDRLKKSHERLKTGEYSVRPLVVGDFVEKAAKFFAEHMQDWQPIDLLHVIRMAWVRDLMTEKPKRGFDSLFNCRRAWNLGRVFDCNQHGQTFIDEMAREECYQFNLCEQEIGLKWVEAAEHLGAKFNESSQQTESVLNR